MITAKGFEKMSAYAETKGLYLKTTTADFGPKICNAIDICRKSDGVALRSFKDNSYSRLKHLKAEIDGIGGFVK